MGNFSDLFLLLLFGAAIGLWLKWLRSLERAVVEARAQCERHGLQLLDESVGLRGLRLRRIDGHLAVERSYSFEVSVDGSDRAPGQLALAGDALTRLDLPTVRLVLPDSDGAAPSFTPRDVDNVVPLRPGLQRLRPPT